MTIAIYLIIGTALGAGTIASLFFFVRRHIVKEAQTEAQEMLTEAQEQFRLDEQERQQVIEEIELELWSKVEEAHLLVEQKCEDLESLVQTKKTTQDETAKAARALLIQKENELREQPLRNVHFVVTTCIQKCFFNDLCIYYRFILLGFP